MIGLRGQRPGTLRFLHDGHMYHHDARYYDDDEEYVCSLRTSKLFKCLATASVDEEGDVDIFGIHTHCRRFASEELRKQEMIMELKQRAITSNDSPNNIFNAVCREFEDIADMVNPLTGRAVIARERQQHRPPMPQSISHIAPMLDRYLPVAEIWRGEVQADDGSVALIFGSVQMVDRMNNVIELFIDGTFQAVPNLPRFTQLLIIHCRRLDLGLPALFVLCERRTTAIYEKIWEFIIDRAPNIRNSLQYVSGDYEKASIQAIRNIMPWTIFRGCWFHFTRAVTRRWRRLGLTRAPDLVLRLTWVLPLVPANRFQEAFEEIRSQARPLEQEYPRIMFFIAYIESYWLPQADRVSTRNSVVRTNNVAEAFNRQLLGRLGGGHLNLFLFLEKLLLIIKDEELKWQRLDRGHDLSAERRAYQASVDSRILNYQRSLDNGRFTVAEFLHSVGLQRVQVAIQDANVRLQAEDYTSDDEMPVLRDLADPVVAGAVHADPVNGVENVLPLARPPRVRRRRRQGVGRAAAIYNAQRAPPAVQRHIAEGRARRPRGRPPGRGRGQNIRPVGLIAEIANEAVVNIEEEAPPEVNNDDGNGVYDRIEVNDFENDEIADGNAGTCSICLLNIPKIIVLPCFHLCLCYHCDFGRQLVDADNRRLNANYHSVCPVCRGNVETTREVYVT